MQSKKFNKITTASALTLALIGSISFAVGVDPVLTASNILKKPVYKIKSDEALGVSLGHQLLAAGKFDDFKLLLLSDVKLKLGEAVSVGKFDESFADKLYREMSFRVPNWDGNGDIYSAYDSSNINK